MQATLYQNMPFAAANSKAPSRLSVSPDSLSDEQLVNLSRTGDRNAFDALIRRYERPIYRLAYRLSGNHDEAEEIAAESFLRIYRGLESFQCAVTLRAWMNRIVANVYYDMRRRSYRHPSVSLEALQDQTGDTFMSTENSGYPSPHAHAEMSERKTILTKAIADLPEHHQLLLSLFHEEGRSYEEIAALLRIPVGTVKSRLNRARMALRHVLAPQMSVLMG